MERDATFDIMKGIGILAVIAGHSILYNGQLSAIDTLFWKLIYSFHMPMFFLIGGLFYKENTNLKQKLIKDSKRLIIPYIITSFAFLFYQFLTDATFHYSYKYTLIAILWGTGESHTSAIWPNMPHIGWIWFLMALFWCRFFFNLIILRFKHPYITIVIIAFAATITDRFIINLPLSILPGLSAMIFYFIGYYFHHFKINQYGIIFCAICWFLHLFFSRIDMCNCFYGCYPIDILGTVFGSLIIYKLSKTIASLPYSKYLNWLGQVSLVIMCFHTLESNIIDYNSVPTIKNNWFILFLTRSILCITLTIIWYIIIYFSMRLSRLFFNYTNNH